MNITFFQGNWVDLVIIIILAFFIIDSWKTGFFIILADFLAFLLSLIISLRAYSLIAVILKNNFSLPNSVSNALGFFVTAGVSEAVLGYIFALILRKIPYKFWKKPWSNIAGIIPSFGQGLILVAFMLTLIVSLPVSPTIKRDVTRSKIGSYLIQKTTTFEAKLSEVFGGLAEDALTYMTVKPGSHESIPLNSEKGELTVDATAESEMFKMINKERSNVGVGELKWRIELVPVARAHAVDMWTRNYFGHVSPDGKDVGNRLEAAGINYMTAGENLALAPTLQTAHTGLMNSEGHRHNILDPQFKRVGIGVIDNGIYGKMFVQVFTD